MFPRITCARHSAAMFFETSVRWHGWISTSEDEGSICGRESGRESGRGRGRGRQPSMGAWGLESSKSWGRGVVKAGRWLIAVDVNGPLLN